MLSNYYMIGSSYRLLAAPYLAILSDQLAARLDAYVREGGTLFLSGREKKK